MPRSPALASLALLALAACETTARDDGAPPDIRLQIEQTGAAGLFTTAQDLGDGECIYPRGVPVGMNLVFSDPGGLRSAFVNIGFGRIVPGSLTVAPTTPDVRVEQRREPVTDRVIVTLSSPAAGIARSGVAITLDAVPEPEDGDIFTVITGATDVFGRFVELPQIDIRLDPTRAFGCRNNPA